MPDPCEILESAGVATDALSVTRTSALTDTAAAVTALAAAVTIALATTAAATDAVASSADNNISTSGVATETLVSSAVRTLVLADAGHATDQVAQGITGFASATANATAAVDVSSYLPLSTSANATDAAVVVLSTSYLELGAATDAVVTGFTSVLSATAAATDSLDLSVDRNIALTATANATSTVSIVRAMTMSLTATAAASDSIAQHLVATTSLVSRGVAYDFIVEDLTGAALWMNTETTALARFPSYPFSGLAQRGEYLLAVGDAGLYVIDTGGNDAGADIESSVLTGMMDFGDPYKKVLDGLLLAGTSEGKLDVTVFSAQGEFTYATHLSAADDAKNNRAQLGRGFNSVYYGFEFNNRASNDFVVADARVEVGATKRKR